MLPINVNRIYSLEDSSIASSIAESSKAIYMKNPCGIKYKPENVHFGMLLMFSKKYEHKMSAKFWKSIQNNHEAALIWKSCSNCQPTACAQGFLGFIDFPQYYFRFLFRMCHAQYLATIGDEKGFLAYLNDGERIRRMIRPRFGEQMAPLFKVDTQIFRDGKKLLSKVLSIQEYK